MNHLYLRTAHKTEKLSVELKSIDKPISTWIVYPCELGPTNQKRSSWTDFY